METVTGLRFGDARVEFLDGEEYAGGRLSCIFIVSIGSSYGVLTIHSTGVNVLL